MELIFSPLQLSKDSTGVEGFVSRSRTALAVSPRLSFFDGENYSQMRRKKAKSGAVEMMTT